MYVISYLWVEAHMESEQCHQEHPRLPGPPKAAGAVSARGPVGVSLYIIIRIFHFLQLKKKRKKMFY